MLNSFFFGEKKLVEEFVVLWMIICKVIDLLVVWGLVVCCYGSGIYLVCKDVLY